MSKVNLVERVESDISYKDFYERFIKRNKPCLLSEKFTENWKARTYWVKSDGSVNYEYFSDNYAEMEVPVVDCSKKYFSSHEKCEMKIKEFFKYWIDRQDKLLYLKDWHLQRKDSGFYCVPAYFTSDWLNEYFDFLNEDDYRFVYIGAKETWTPFHADVFRSFSWSANICGLKKWIFYQPGDEVLLKDRYGKLPFDVTKSENYGYHKGVEVLQKAGEIIFVPSGWYHQVYNIEDTISINHNWVTAANIDSMYSHLCSELESIKKEIDDCRSMDGFEQQCQLILNASCGIDLNGYYKMLIYLMKKRMQLVDEISSSSKNTSDFKNIFSTIFISSSATDTSECLSIPVSDKIENLYFDLSQLKEVLRRLLSNEDFCTIASETDIVNGKILMEKSTTCNDIRLT